MRSWIVVSGSNSRDAVAAGTTTSETEASAATDCGSVAATAAGRWSTRFSGAMNSQERDADSRAHSRSQQFSPAIAVATVATAPEQQMANANSTTSAAVIRLTT